MSAVLLLVTLRLLNALRFDEVPESQRALFDRLGVEEAWDITRGSPDVVVGVIDNGFDFFHPALKDKVRPGFYYPGGFHPEVYENLAHGTMVASLIVGSHLDDSCMTGLAPECTVLAASQGMIEHKILQFQSEWSRQHPGGSIQEMQKDMNANQDLLRSFGKNWATYQVRGAAQAVRYLVDQGVRVINFSGGLQRSLCPEESDWKEIEEAFAYAEQANVVNVISAGNSAVRSEDYPGNADTVIIAGAALLDDARWERSVEMQGVSFKEGSNFGKRLTCMAPVENLRVCAPHEKRFYASESGPLGATRVPFPGAYETRAIGATSCAAPIVSSLVALVISVRPDLDARTVVAIVKQGCDDLGPEGFDEMTGHGRVHFGRTLELALDWE